MSRSSSSSLKTRIELQNIHRDEERADKLDREGRDRSSRERPPLAREERVEAILSQRTRTTYTDRDRSYSLRDSEIHTLSEVGKFRVVATGDLAEFAYNGDRLRMASDIESLVRQGLMRKTGIADTERNPAQVPRGQNTKMGRSDPTLDGFQPPKPLWGRSGLSPQNGDRVLPACMQRCNQPDCGVGIIPSTGRR